MKTIKAGTYMVNTQNKTVAVVHREKQNDYSFPKGHLDEGETILECAIRETEEETKHTPKIMDIEPFIEEYKTPKGEECICYMFYAIDDGESNNTYWDTHPTKWIKLEEVENVLTYDSLKKSWAVAKEIIKKIIEQKNV